MNRTLKRPLDPHLNGATLAFQTFVKEHKFLRYPIYFMEKKDDKSEV